MLKMPNTFTNREYGELLGDTEETYKEFTQFLLNKQPNLSEIELQDIWKGYQEYLDDDIANYPSGYESI